MKYKIVSDSASDLLTLDHVPFASVPLHIIIGTHEFIDNEEIDLSEMEVALYSGKNRSSTTCPNTEEWLQAFGDAETVFCVTITSALSGSYNSAHIAAKEYETLHPGRCVYILDSLSTGPEMVLIIEKLQELILADKDKDTILRETSDYMDHTRLLFALEDMTNLANNGRVSPVIAKFAGLIGIRVVGTASSKGELQLLSKCRGARCVLSSIVKFMKEMGFTGGKVRIAHNRNENAAQHLKKLIQESFGAPDTSIHTTRALCSYYAERGGILIGMECNPLSPAW